MIEGFYSVERVTDRITAIRALSSETMYLVMGTEKALLIDTGVGCPGLRRIVDGLTALPLTVWITHGHVDHALGAVEFERVCMSPLDREVFMEHSDTGMRLGYIRSMPDERLRDIGAADLLPPADPDSFLPLADGMSVDLGGIRVEALAAAGHTAGSLAFLIPEERLLLTGDACNPFTLLFDLSVSAYMTSMEALARRTEGKYDAVLLTHRATIGEKDMLYSMLRTGKRVQKGEDSGIPMEVFGRRMALAFPADEQARRLDGECANLVYDKNNL